jgi:hypothetical protein
MMSLNLLSYVDILCCVFYEIEMLQDQCRMIKDLPTTMYVVSRNEIFLFFVKCISYIVSSDYECCYLVSSTME